MNEMMEITVPLAWLEALAIIRGHPGWVTREELIEEMS